MRMFFHLLGNDLRRFRLMVGAWIALAVAGVLLYAAAPGMAGDARLFGTVQTTAGLLWFARQILTIALVPFIVHAHPAVGSTAFWMTRPIPPRLLIASKMLLIFGVTVGVPVAGDLALALWLHIPARDTFLAALQVALANGIWVALLMTLAVLTRTFAQFALASGIVVAGAALISMLVGLVATLRARTPQVLTTTESDPLIPLVAALILAAFLAATWVVQYIRRNRSESIPVGAAGLCLALVFAGMVRPPLIASHIEPPQWAGSATLELGTSPVTPYWSRGDGTGTAVLRGRLVIPEMPPGWFAKATLRDASIAVDGNKPTGAGPLYVSRGWGRVPAPAGSAAVLSREANNAGEQLAIREALEVDRILNLPLHGAEHGVVFVAPDDDVERLTSVHGTYRGTFRVDLKHAEALAALPLTRGATFQDAGYRVTVSEVQLAEPLTIRLRQSNAATMFPRPSRPAYDFYLRNRGHREAVGGYIVSYLHPRFLIPFVGGIVEMANATPGVTTTVDSLIFRGGFGGTQSELTPEWLKDAELVIVRTTNAGTVERLLQIDDFRWPPVRKQ